MVPKSVITRSEATRDLALRSANGEIPRLRLVMTLPLDIDAVESRGLISTMRDPNLAAIVRSQIPLVYADGADTTTDRPAHVRAASGLAGEVIGATGLDTPGRRTRTAAAA